MAKKKSNAKKQQQVVEEEEKVVDNMDDDASTSSSEAGEAADDGESSSSEGEGSDASSGSDDASGSGSDAMSEDDEEGSEEGSDNEEEKGSGNNNNNNNTLSNSDHAEPCTFDLSNLLAFNTHQVNSAELYKKQSSSSSSSSNNNEWYATIPTIQAANTTHHVPSINEALLLSKAAEGATQLLAELWKLPSEKTDVGLLAKLPSAESKLPRSLPPPPPKKLTKWEQFAIQRGITPQTKQSRKVYDEATGDWKHLTGSLQNKANAGPESWPILEVKKNDDPMADPWEKIREEKKGRVNKNVEARMKNAENSGALERGSANKFRKNNDRLEKQREIAREKDAKRGLSAPAGVPSDFKSDAKRGKPSTQLALRATQVSTASLGKFDKQREGEPEKQLSKSIHGKKRKQLDNSAGGGGTNKKFLQSEAQKSTNILEKVMTGGSSKEKERDVKKGKYAKGETAYDYEFDDGLGAGSFKKKKGRAGMGKMKKVTKKRIK